MFDLTDSEIDAALARGRTAREREPRGLTAHYDGQRVVVELTTGCLFAFPPQRVQGLQRVAHTDSAAVEILGAGTGLRWDTLDVDVSVPGLLAGLFGRAAFMAQRAGRARSPRKAAARTNGTKEGRPPVKA